VTPLQAIRAYLGGVEAQRRGAGVRMNGEPVQLRLRYLGGHPGIPVPTAVWVWRAGDRLRLAACDWRTRQDLPLDRIRGITCEPDGRVVLRFEPTAGLLTRIQFQSEDNGVDTYLLVARLLSRGA